MQDISAAIDMSERQPELPHDEPCKPQSPSEAVLDTMQHNVRHDTGHDFTCCREKALPWREQQQQQPCYMTTWSTKFWLTLAAIIGIALGMLATITAALWVGMSYSAVSTVIAGGGLVTASLCCALCYQCYHKSAGRDSKATIKFRLSRGFTSEGESDRLSATSNSWLPQHSFSTAMESQSRDNPLAAFTNECEYLTPSSTSRTRLDSGQSRARMDSSPSRMLLSGSASRARTDGSASRTRMDSGASRTRVDSGASRTRTGSSASRIHVDSSTSRVHMGSSTPRVHLENSLTEGGTEKQQQKTLQPQGLTLPQTVLVTVQLQTSYASLSSMT